MPNSTTTTPTNRAHSNATTAPTHSPKGYIIVSASDAGTDRRLVDGEDIGFIIIDDLGPMEIEPLYGEPDMDSIVLSCQDFSLPPRHKDPLYDAKFASYLKYKEICFLIVLSLFVCIYATSFHRRMMFSKSGFVARAGRSKRN